MILLLYCMHVTKIYLRVPVQERIFFYLKIQNYVNQHRLHIKIQVKDPIDGFNAVHRMKQSQ